MDTDDNPPLSDDELAGMRRVSLAKRIRWRLGLSQQEFSSAYKIALGTLRDWEQNRAQPEGPAVTLLELIEADPEGVRKALTTLRRRRRVRRADAEIASR